jgi:hypothetical protein
MAIHDQYILMGGSFNPQIVAGRLNAADVVNQPDKIVPTAVILNDLPGSVGAHTIHDDDLYPIKIIICGYYGIQAFVYTGIFVVAGENYGNGRPFKH